MSGEDGLVELVCDFLCDAAFGDPGFHWTERMGVFANTESRVVDDWRNDGGEAFVIQGKFAFECGALFIDDAIKVACRCVDGVARVERGEEAGFVHMTVFGYPQCAVGIQHDVGDIGVVEGGADNWSEGAEELATQALGRVGDGVVHVVVM